MGKPDENLRTRKKRVNVSGPSVARKEDPLLQDYLGAFLERPLVTHEPRTSTERPLRVRPFEKTAKQDETKATPSGSASPFSTSKTDYSSPGVRMQFYVRRIFISSRRLARAKRENSCLVNQTVRFVS